MIQFSEKTISREFRDLLAATFPRLENNTSYWRMLQYILFGGWSDGDDTDALMVPAELICAIEGYESHDPKHYSAYKFLELFRKNIVDFELSSFEYSARLGAGKVRTISNIQIPAHLKPIIDAERRASGEERVWMGSGKKWLRKHTSEQRKQARHEAELAAEEAIVCPQTQALRNYMNTLPPNRFTSALKHLPQAIEVASTLKDADNQLNLLMSIRDQAQPFYSASPKTTRIFSMNESMLRLHRDLRKVLTQDWMTADLRSAQLAIVAKVWDRPEVEAYLRSGQSIWRDLCDHMGLDFTPDNKALVKTPTYSVVFGAGERRIREYFKKWLGGDDDYDKFRHHPIISTLFVARKKTARKD